MSTSPVFSTLFRDVTVADTVYRPIPFLGVSTQYYWRVCSNNNGGGGAFSGTYTFATGADTNRAVISVQNLDLGTNEAGPPRM